VTRAVGRELLARCRRTGGEALLGDKGYAARERAGAARSCGVVDKLGAAAV
jgi:hypothetical protein